MKEFSINDKKKYTDILAGSLSAFRAMLELSQSELSKLIDVSRNTVYLIETKKRDMSWSAFVALTLLFLKNDKTKSLVEVIGLYDDKLDNFLMCVDKRR